MHISLFFANNINVQRNTFFRIEYQRDSPCLTKIYASSASHAIVINEIDFLLLGIECICIKWTFLLACLAARTQLLIYFGYIPGRYELPDRILE